MEGRGWSCPPSFRTCPPSLPSSTIRPLFPTLSEGRKEVDLHRSGPNKEHSGSRNTYTTLSRSLVLMVLLHWCTLVPEGESSLAAIRFTAPIRVSFIRVFPTGARPFAQHSPELVACTEPDAFFLDVFFNAHPTSTESKDKQRAANALVPTSIAYAGGQVDFSVDMGTEYATRLMIVKGSFQSISIAIYGETVSEPVSDIPVYEAKPLPSVDPRPLSRAVDPSSMLDPTRLANQLLSLIPDSPPLALVIRLMFCLKPSNEDWDLPEFPYLHADLDAENEPFDLEMALLCTAKPVRDDISYESLSAFANKVAESIGPKSSNQAYLVAKLLCISAPQHPDMARTLLQQVDLDAVFDTRTMDESTLLRLLDAVSNADIARYFSGSWFLAELDKLQASPTTEKYSKAVARRLSARIRRWDAFEDALSNPAGDFRETTEMLKDVGREEQSIGIWLETMLNHPNLAAKLAGNPVATDPRAALPRLFRDATAGVTHDDLIAFVRAFVGVASVLAVWAWTDSLGNDECRAQTLAIVRLWQNVDGYREIVNHLLLLRQLTRRLEWITTDNIPPRKSGVLAEQILADLTREPHAILRDDVVRTILSLDPPLSFIAEHERLSMRKVALVAEDGLPAAIEELTFSSSHPLSLRRLRTIRVSLAIIQRELEDADADSGGEWRILEALWDESAHGFVERLVDIFLGVADDLNAHFVVLEPMPMNQTLVGQLFRTSDDLLRLIAHLTPALALTSRALRNLTASIADVFACTDAAMALFSLQSGSAAKDLRQTCLDLVHKFSEPAVYAEPRKPGAEVVLRALLEHGVQARGRDPTSHFLQVFTLIDHILPHTAYDDDDPWVTLVLPNVLSEFGAFFRLLDPGNKTHLINRLVKLDAGVIGIGEWLFMEEMKHLEQTLEALRHGVASRELELTRHHQVFLTLRFICNVLDASSSISEWCMSTISSVPEVSQGFAACLTTLLDTHLVSPVLNDVTRILAIRADEFDPDLKFALVLSSLRAFQHEPLVLLNVLKELPADSDAHHREMLRLEIGQTLSAIARTEMMPAKTAQTVLSILVWLVDQASSKMNTLCGISVVSLSHLYAKLEETLPRSSIAALGSVKISIRLDDDDAMIPASVELPGRLELSLQDIESLLHPVVSPPSTPKATSNTPDILGVMTSPTALLRSPAATGLTKTYANNDFRVLRQAPSARLNTSRLPSMHVDVGIHGRST
ncbi:hypothetical protein MVEN_01203100 [Mycena venus]|uniref:Virilizer N-terminal domain-containing protein n=1 Tax=Mycena venus TaxID=2733690 RepID=A0A8H6Y318_9AGAR|nr:hypothetical protein MVEN_01203100 [Mycena venus]